MDVIDQHLRNVYNTLTATALVRGQVSADSIAEFTVELNKASTLSPQEKGAGDMFRYLKSCNENRFSKFINDSNVNHLMLMAGGTAIARHFGIDRLVKISWCNKTQEFIVARAVTRRENGRNYGQNRGRINSPARAPTNYDIVMEPDTTCLEPALSAEECSAIFNITDWKPSTRSWADD